MVPPTADLVLLGAYVLLLVLLAVQYRRGKVARRRVPLLLGLCLTWLSYSLLQVTQDGLVPTGTALNAALDVLAVVCLVAGLYGLYWWWRHGRNAGGDAAGG